MVTKQRFFNKIKKTSTCWIWIAAKDGLGYGDFRFNKRLTKAHRVSWILKYGNIPKKLCVCHKCNNKSCVRPSHLYLATQKQNMHDAAKDKLCWGPKGESQHCHKLTEIQVKEIRKLYHPFTFSYRKLGKMYGVTYQAIIHIVNRKNWTHI